MAALPQGNHGQKNLKLAQIQRSVISLTRTALCLVSLCTPVLAQQSGWKPVGKIKTLEEADKTKSKAKNNSASSPARKVLEQKLKALDKLLASPSSLEIFKSEDTTARNFALQARYLRTVGVGFLEEGDVGLADEKITAAFQKISEATKAYSWAKPTGEDPAEHKQKREFIDYVEAAKQYRATFIAAARQQGPSVASLLDVGHVDRLLTQAQSEADKGHYKNASAIAGEAYRMTESAVVSLSNNSTVVYQNSFQTPAEEFRYEEERYLTYAQLVSAKIGEIQLNEVKTDVVVKLITKADTYHVNALESAKRGDYEDATDNVEAAISQLIRVLSAMGIMVPG